MPFFKLLTAAVDKQMCNLDRTVDLAKCAALHADACQELDTGRFGNAPSFDKRANIFGATGITLQVFIDAADNLITTRGIVPALRHAASDFRVAHDGNADFEIIGEITKLIDRLGIRVLSLINDEKRTFAAA